MALPPKTIESTERMAERLETWAKWWGRQMLKNKPQNLRQFRASLLALSGSTSFPEFGFKMEFHAGLNTALERFEYVKEELQHYMPDMATTVQKKHEDLVSEAKSIGQMAPDDPTWFKRFNKSRSLAKDLATTLRHVAEMAREDSSRAGQKGMRRSTGKSSRPKSIRKRFSFRQGQVLFDGRDLNMGTGVAPRILQTLVKNFGQVVSFQTLDKRSLEKEASEQIRTAIARLRRVMRSKKIPAEIENRKGEGYLMRPTAK